MPFDEQVGNSNYLTMTPGSAVAGQLQNILAQKRDTARQAMLDELTSRNVNSQIADRDQQAKTNEAYRAALASSREAQEEQHRASMLSPNQDLVGTDLEYWQQHNPSMVIPGQEEQPQFDYEGEAPLPAASPKFRGTPERIEAQRKLDIQNDAMKQLHGDTSKMTPLQKEMLFHSAYGTNAPQGVLNPPEENWSPVYTAQGVDTVNWAPKETHFLPNEPRQPQDPPLAQMQGTRDGKPVLVVVDRKGQAREVAMPEGVEFAGKVPTHAAASQKPPRVTDSTWKLWTSALNNSIKKSGDPNSEHELNAQAARIAQELGLGAHLSQPILAAFKNPKNRGRTPSFAGGTPEEIEASQKLWGLLTGGFQAPSVE